MRNCLTELIKQWMKMDERVLFLTADIGGGIYKVLKEIDEERVINVGIAEQNMIGMAAGLTDMGYRVICYSKACFISLRVADQIKNALCYAAKNVILIAADAGFDESNAGHPHIALEDMGIIQSMPEIDIFMPTTYFGLRQIFRFVQSSELPSYIRMNKDKICEEKLELKELCPFAYYLRCSGKKNILYLTYGVSAIQTLNEVGKETQANILAIDALYFDDNNLIKEICKYKKVVVVEEQFETGGLYAALCRLFIKNRIITVELKRIGPEFKYLQRCFDRNGMMDTIKREWRSING